MTDNGFYEGVIIAGFGGQGIILAGKLLAQTAMRAGKEVTYMPAYGAEVRGGTSNCTVVISEEPIASPVISKPDSLIIMNKASLEKFHCLPGVAFVLEDLTQFHMGGLEQIIGLIGLACKGYTPVQGPL